MEMVSKKMASFAVGLRYEDLPEEVTHTAKRFLFDSMGCAFGGYRVEDAEIALGVVDEMGGNPEATVIGSGSRTSAVNASLVNSLMVRAMDYNDIYWRQDPSHPSDLIPAVLATAEKNQKSGKDVIVGIVLAYEFEMRLCEFAFPGIRERKWHHATLTQFASPIAAGKMLDLTIEQMTHAIGISGSHNFTPGAVTAGKLTMMKNTVDPMAVQSGVFAAQLAKKGYHGPEAIFEGKEGFVDTFGAEFDLNILTDGLGESFRIMECSMKAFPTEALTHSPITATLDLVHEEKIAPENVKKVIVHTIERSKDILADPSKYKPTTKETADHSLPYVVAAAIVDGKITPDQFSPEKLKDEKIWALLPKIDVVADPELEKVFPELKATLVEIQTTDGKIHRKRVDYPKGDYRSPMSEEDLLIKFNSLANPIFSTHKQKVIEDAVWHLEEIPQASDFMELMVADRE